ncbi:MAG TPA: zinc ribbon domain-containing protein [Bryobacterales bacterium]|nr:zinc ribbon domain-containing protein [Bryobacterales bacterium]
MKCSECGEGLRDGDKFCIRCGAGVETAAAAREAASEPEDCSRCGAALIPGDRFCKGCGASVGAGIAEKKTTRLSTPLDTKYEAVEPSPVAAAPEVVAGPAVRIPPRSTPKQSNRTFYQLLGLALVLIACGYLAYDYFVTPRHQGTILVAQQEAGEGAQEAVAADAEGEGEGLPPAAPPATPQSQASVPRIPAASRPADDVRPAPLAKRPPIESVHPVPEANQSAAPVRPAPKLDRPAAAPPVAVPAAAPSPAAAPRVPSPPVASPAVPPKAVVSSPPAPSQPKQQPEPGTVLLPGSQAWKPPSKAAAPQAAAPATAPSRPAVPAPAPPPPPAANEGIIYWTGKLEKNKVVVIENSKVNMGQVSGNLFTGIPVDVHLPSPAVALVERPTAQNNWRRVAFRCLRNTDGAVTINVQWNLLR